MVDIIRVPLDVVVTVVQVHQLLPQKISLPNMTLPVLDTASRLPSLAVLVLVVVFPYRLTKELYPTREPTCKLVVAVQHTLAVAAPAGHLLGLHLLPAAAMLQ